MFLPRHGSLLLLLRTNPLLEVLQLLARLQLQSELALILRRTYNVTEKRGDIKATGFHQMH